MVVREKLDAAEMRVAVMAFALMITIIAGLLAWVGL